MATELELSARDGFQLAARLWTLPTNGPVKSSALINSGAGITSRFYDRFAAFLAESGIPTLVYDYRGIARSRPRILRGFKASVEEWGSKDCAAMLDWLSARFPSAERIVIGHSVGGFVTGFVTNGAMIDKLLLISAHTGYWRDYAASARVPMFILWHALMPAITRAVGYFPGQRLRLLEDLPKDVALEWARRRRPEFWHHLRTPDGSIDQDLVDAFLARFAAIRAPALVLRFTDDPFATAEATDRILGLLASVNPSYLVISPRDIDSRKIGHFGFFSSRFRTSLWPRVLRELRARQD